MISDAGALEYSKQTPREERPSELKREMDWAKGQVDPDMKGGDILADEEPLYHAVCIAGGLIGYIALGLLCSSVTHMILFLCHSNCSSVVDKPNVSKLIRVQSTTSLYPYISQILGP